MGNRSGLEQAQSKRESLEEALQKETRFPRGVGGRVARCKLNGGLD